MDFLAEDAEHDLADGQLLRMWFAELSASQRDHYLSFFRTAEDLRGPLHWYRANLSPDTPRQSLGPVRVPTMFIWAMKTRRSATTDRS